MNNRTLQADEVDARGTEPVKFVVDVDEFDLARALLGRLVSATEPLSRDAFAEALTSFEFISFLSVFNRAFFRSMKNFCGQLGDEAFIVLATDPDPTWYRREFGRFNALWCSVHDSPEHYLQAMNDGGDGSSPDCLMDSSNRIFFYSESGKWLLAADRDTNLTTCCFADESVRDKFAQSYEGDFFGSVEDAAEFSRETGSPDASLASFLPGKR